MQGESRQISLVLDSSITDQPNQAERWRRLASSPGFEQELTHEDTEHLHEVRRLGMTEHVERRGFPIVPERVIRNYLPPPSSVPRGIETLTLERGAYEYVKRGRNHCS